MYKTEILADPSKGHVHGNVVTLEADLTSEPGATGAVEHLVGLAFTFNTGHDDEPDTEVYIPLPLNEASNLAAQLNVLVAEAAKEEIETLKKVVEFRNAQLACVKGQVGKLTIARIGDSDRGGAPGFGIYTLEYFDDQADTTMLHSVEEIECYVPPVQDDQYEWLRTLVGGNHQFTTEIAVNLEGFTFDQIREEFDAHMAKRVQG